MIKITCTIGEQKILIESLAARKCPFGSQCLDKEFYCYNNCEECIEDNIEWEIIDKEEN